jgi:prefoldin subunit 5
MYKEAYEEAIEALSNSIGDIDNVINYYRDELDQATKNELLQTIQTLELLIKKFQNKAQSL